MDDAYPRGFCLIVAGLVCTVVNAYQGGQKRPETMNDLNSLIQKPGGMLRHYM